MFRTTFIAITGSLGKTTAKECLSAILSSHFSTVKTLLNQNDIYGLPRNILRVRPWHRFAVLELGIGKPDHMKTLAPIILPDVAIILNIKRTHTTAFRDLDEHAYAKSLLLDKLRPGGVAVLNGDDPRVTAMADHERFKVRFFGTSSSFNLWANQVTGRWPERLKFYVHSNNETHDVETQLVGTHWLPSVLSALTTATFFNVSLKECITGLNNVEPFPGRLQPVRLPMGAIILRDDYIANIDVLEASLRVLKDASASRRLLVMSDFSDFGKNRRNRLRYLGQQAVRVADVFVIIGESSAYGRRRAIEEGMGTENVHAFKFPEQAVEFLRAELKQGDLMMLKGRTTDHIARIFFALLGNIKCWKRKCSKTVLCDHCPELGASNRDFRQLVLVK